MKRGVESSDVFCLFLTKGLFHSYYVRLELEWAVEARKPIVLLYPTNELIKFSPEEAGPFRPHFAAEMFETMVWVKYRTKEDDVTTMMNKLLETVDRPSDRPRLRC